MNVFKVNLVFSKNVNKETLINDIFDSAIDAVNDMLSMQKKNKKLREESLAIYVIKNRQIWEYLKNQKETAEVVEVEDGYRLSFDVPNQAGFEEKSENGNRIWLRQHIEDTLINYANSGLYAKVLDYYKENKDIPPDNFIPDLLIDEFAQIFENGEESQRFSISGE